MSLPQKLNLDAAFARILQPWTPHIAAEVVETRSGARTQVRLAVLEGAFVWHCHPHEDELFLVLAGRLTMRFREGDVMLLPGELIRVPAGMEHCPVGEEGCRVLLVEPAGVINTGDAPEEARTAHALVRLDGAD